MNTGAQGLHILVSFVTSSSSRDALAVASELSSPGRVTWLLYHPQSLEPGKRQVQGELHRSNADAECEIGFYRRALLTSDIPARI